MGGVRDGTGERQEAGADQMGTILGVILTSALTITGAILVYAFTRIYVEPGIDLRRVIGEIDYALYFYADIYTNPGKSKTEYMQEAHEALRRLASELVSRANAIIHYGLARCFCMLPSSGNVQEASKELRFLSNSIFQGDASENKKARNNIQKLLGLKAW